MIATPIDGPSTYSGLAGHIVTAIKPASGAARNAGHANRVRPRAKLHDRDRREQPEGHEQPMFADQFKEADHQNLTRCTRWFSVSITWTRPLASTTKAQGSANCPGPRPPLPHVARCRPSASNF